MEDGKIVEYVADSEDSRKLQNVLLRLLVRSLYDVQKLRIEVGNRLVANIRAKLGQQPGTKTEMIPENAQKLLDFLAATYHRLADACTSKYGRRRIEEFEITEGVIADKAEVSLIAHYVSLLEAETALGKTIEGEVKKYEVWNSFLAKVKGVGPLMAAVLVSELDPHKARYVSSFWRYTGLDVGPDGRGRSRRAEHLVEVEYKTRDGQIATRRSITFNPFLKTKLIGVLATSFLRSNSPYREIYDNYKHRLVNHPNHKDKTKAHIHNMAVRYMIKMFLKDLWVAMRKAENLPAAPPYAEVKLGLKHETREEAVEIA